MAQVFPTKANLMATQKSLDLAKLGYELMDRKRNILVREMMQLISEAKEVEANINAVYDKAYSSLKLANITLGVCGNFARTIPVDNGLSLDFRSVMGVEIPKISLESSKLMPYFGFNSTNSHLDEAYINFNEAKKNDRKACRNRGFDLPSCGCSQKNAKACQRVKQHNDTSVYGYD